MNHPKLNTLEPQTFKGRPLRLSGTALITKQPAIWINGKGYCHATIHTYRYLDTDNEFVAFEFSAKDEFIRKIENNALNQLK